MGKTNFDSYWEAFYCGIDVCNLALKYVPLNTAIGKTKKRTYLGEAQIIKSFLLFFISKYLSLCALQCYSFY